MYLVIAYTHFADTLAQIGNDIDCVNQLPFLLIDVKWLLQSKRLWNSLESDWLWKFDFEEMLLFNFSIFCKWNFLKNMADFFAKMSAVYRTYKITKKLSFQNTCPCQKFCQKNFSAKNSELLLSHWDLQNVLPFHFLDISSCLLSDYLDKTFRVRAARNSAKAQSSGMFNRNKKDSYKVFLHPSICNWFISCFFWLRHEFRKILSSLIMLSAPHIFAHWRNECLKRIRNWGHKMGKSMVVKKLSLRKRKKKDQNLIFLSQI